MRLRNTFLHFDDERSSPKLRRCSTDPYIVSESTGCSDAAPVYFKVFVGSLPANCDEACLSMLMSYFGDVVKVVIKRNLTTGQSRRYGYVKFREPPDRAIFDQQWIIGEKVIRIRPYEINPCWKNQYVSEDDNR
jgi:hypothetical protein